MKQLNLQHSCKLRMFYKVLKYCHSQNRGDNLKRQIFTKYKESQYTVHSDETQSRTLRIELPDFIFS